MIYALAVTWLAVCALIGYVGRHRALGFWGFFLICMVVGPFLSILLLALTSTSVKRG